MTQTEKATAFQRLHEGPGAFVIPNPWDIGTARILAGLGFEALATTSGGLAYMLGRRDAQGLVSREETLRDATAIVETIRLAAEAGLVGGSIEDATELPDAPVYPLAHAVERVAAAVEAARALPFPFVLTARAENYLYGLRDLDDTIARLQAFEAAGADVLYAPGLRDLEEIRTVCSAVSKPVNVLPLSSALSVDALAEAGVRRISLGTDLVRAALGAFLRAAQEVRAQGTFGFLDEAASGSDVNPFMLGR
jgi:2-methylisocitrate lyase-like PEP mutase family enzyme